MVLEGPWHSKFQLACCIAALLLLLPAAVPAADPLHLRANAALIVLSMVVLDFCYSAVACGEQRPLCLSRLGKVFSAGLLSLAEYRGPGITFAGSKATDCRRWNF